MRLQVGQIVLGRYLVQTLHDQGGMARVYRAEHTTLGTPVALKVLTFEHDEELVERFNREAQMMARVHHPNVVQILDFGIVDGVIPCIAMEYVDGEPLDMRLVRQGAMPWTEAVDLVLGVLAGLDAIHAAGVLHRDLKPENVIVVPGNPERPKLIDFGIALQEAAFDRKLTQAGETVGTPAYMSPEQLYGIPLTASTDIYSAALVLYELITQDLPNPADATEALQMRVNNQLPMPIAPAGRPAIPEELVDLIYQALEPDPRDRPTTARWFAKRLREIKRAVRGLRTSTPTPGQPAAPPPKPKPQRSTGWRPPAWAQPGAKEKWKRGDGPAPQVRSTPTSGKAAEDPRPEPSNPLIDEPSRPSPRRKNVPTAGRPLTAAALLRRPQDRSRSASPSPSTSTSRPADAQGRQESPPDAGRPPEARRSTPERPPEAPRATEAFGGSSDPTVPASRPKATASFDKSAIARALENPVTAAEQPTPTGGHEAGSQPIAAGGTDRRTRLIFVARLPKIRIRLPSEQRWLESRVAPFGRGFTVAGNYFVTSIKAGTDPDAVKEAEALVDALKTRYDGEVSAQWAPVDEDVSMSPSSMPPVAQGLMHMVARS